MLARGKPGQELFELADDGKRVSVKARADYFPVKFIFPLEGNRTAIGFDLGSERERRKAIERARDTGRLSMVAPIYLLQPQGGVPGMIMCWPVYREAVRLTSVTRRRDALTGVACGLYQIDRLFNAAASGFDADIALHLLDKSRREDDRWYYTRPSPHATAAGQGTAAAPTLAALTDDFHGQAAVNFAGHEWLVVATPGPDFVRANRTWLPWGLLGLFLTLGFGLSSIMIERISAQKRLREQQRRTEEALQVAQAANEAKSYFMAAASHDIKQPLYALGILTDTLLMSNPPENTKPIIKSLRKSINEMSQHFDTLMDVGRFQDGSFEMRATTFSLSQLARRIAQEIGPLCREKGLRWNIDFDDVDVYSDPELLLRLIRNLLINGVRYTEQGSISCNAKRRGGAVEFTISDTGPGLSPDQRDLVFSEVTHVRPDVIHTSGFGLGLSIVNRISQALDLGMKVSSQEHQGTTFTFRVPLDGA
jgi:signal transduction histidine kinase